MSRCMIGLAILVLLASVVVAGEEEVAWFDFENCAMCSNMDPEMMNHATWEQYDMTNGVLSITTVEEKYLPGFRKAHEGMIEAGKKMAEGTQMSMCGSCTALGMSFAKGAAYEYIMTSNGCAMVITAATPEVVEELHKWAARNKEEMTKMEEAKAKG